LPLEDYDDVDDEEDADSHQQRKRMKLSKNDGGETESISKEADYCANRISATWEASYE